MKTGARLTRINQHPAYVVAVWLTKERAEMAFLIAKTGAHLTQAKQNPAYVVAGFLTSAGIHVTAIYLFATKCDRRPSS